MNPKEKAEDLIDKFLEETYLQDHNEAVQCALICVQECIDTTRGKYGDYISMQYWLDVEKEIEQL